MVLPLRSSVALALVLAVTGCAHAPPGRNAGTLRLYLARHGQTDWNAERRLQGGTDTHLNATGRQQAEALAERLRHVPLDRVYSSTLARSRETAEIVRGSVPLESLAGLAEQRLGKFEGLRLGSGDSAVAEFERRSRDPQDGLDGGESTNQHFERVRAAVDEVLARHPSGTVLIVGHGGTNKLILRRLLGLGPEQADAIRQSNDELYLIEMDAAGAARLWKAIGSSNLGDL